MRLFTIKKACLDNAHKYNFCFEVYFTGFLRLSEHFDGKITLE